MAAAQAYGQGDDSLSEFSQSGADRQRSAPLFYFDAELTRRLKKPGVTLVFIDAKFTRKQLQPAVEQIKADTYWNSKGVAIPDVYVLPDGSGLLLRSPWADKVRQEVMERYKPYVAKVLTQDQ
ncbi:hypothetical protein GCM10010193_38750 [Kitasatospora atroaurantiaca]|uniref:Uncharacterized protein n=1 Tax=Kitasatospora atroaurantiaca TaxID=285545 RepID=A0A561EU96_9ACTN|nr:hypothetical protein [Kitasatospora atroaurantiaca]TWE19192.1 hypothetical protein FB465_4303 [Kitasatospora atroaurantiaca]